VLARELTRILATSDFQRLQPEMAIAITPFVGFCGFLPPKDIALYLQVVPEFASLVDADISSSFQSLVSPTSSDLSPVSPNEYLIKSGIRQVFGSVMASPAAKVKEAVSALISRYKKGEVKSVESGVRDLAITLDRQFPDDVGVLCIFLLNVVRLDAGDAIFLQANEPHAYISGG
jgi:mannose-6-phosphate isomerase